MRTLALFFLFFVAAHCARIRTGERESNQPYQAPLAEARGAEELSCEQAGNIWDIGTHKCYTREAYCLKTKDAIWSNRKCLSKKEQCEGRGDGSQWRDPKCLTAEEACLLDKRVWQDGKCQSSESLCLAKGFLWKFNEQGLCVLKNFRDICDDSNLDEEAGFTLAVLKEQSGSSTCEGVESWMQAQTKFHYVGTEGRRKIRNLSPLIGFTILVELVLESNSIEDLLPLAAMTELQTLHLQGNEIRDLKPLGELIKLKTLYLGRNKIIELGHLEKLINLETLSLWDNRISSIAPLAKLNKLVEVRLNTNQISDASPLKTLIRLERLSLDQNPIAIRENKNDANCPKEPWVPKVLRTFCID